MARTELILVLAATVACGDASPPADDVPGNDAGVDSPVADAQPAADAVTTDVAPDAPAAPVPAHVLTADYWLSSALVADCAKVAPYLTYIYPLSSEYAAYHACGIKTVVYLTPSMPQKGETEYDLISGTYADVSAKDCQNAVVTTYQGSGYLMDPHATNAATFYQATIDAHVTSVQKGNGGVTPDAIFSDNSDSDYGASAQPCSWKGFVDWTQATKGVLSKLDTHGAELFLNDLTLPEAYQVIPAGDTVANVVDSLSPAPVTGGEQEGFVYELLGHPDRWSMEIDTEIATIAAGKTYWAYGNQHLSKLDPTSASGLAARMYLYASFLLAYEPDHAIFQEWFTTPSTFKVMPETGLVPMQPLATAKSDVGELSSGGVYVREFGACYYRGTLVGTCAAVVNPSLAAVNVALPKYAHSVVLSGSDVLDGGTIALDGPPVTSLGAQEAAILLP